MRMMLTIQNELICTKSILLSDLRLRDPLDWFVSCHHLFMNTNHFHAHYDEWRMRRIRKVMELYEGDFKDKRVLEVGGGMGDIGAFFARLGADVISLENRAMNRHLAQIKFRDLENFKSMACDVEEDFSDLGRFDIIINFGLLEVIKNIDNVMGCCAAMSDHVFVESLVCDSTDPGKVIYREMIEGMDHPVEGRGARPSPFYVERFFETRGFETHRAFSEDLNSKGHMYNWEHEDSGKTEDFMRRFWYFTKYK